LYNTFHIKGRFENITVTEVSHQKSTEEHHSWTNCESLGVSGHIQQFYNSSCFGGLWEASIQSMKYHLRKTFGNKSVISDEFLKLPSQTEACRNSQPRTVHSSKPHDLN